MKDFLSFDEVVDKIYALLEIQRMKQIEINKLNAEYEEQNKELKKLLNTAEEIWPEAFKELML